MATLNPLEQKARSSFIKGFIIAIFLGIIVAGILGMQLFKINGEEKQRLSAQKPVMILNQNVKSGDLITEDMFDTIRVDAAEAGEDAVTEYDDLRNYFLKDVNGNKIQNETDKNGETKKYIYISAETDSKNKNSGKHEVLTDDNGRLYYKDSNGAIQYITLDETALVSKIDLSSKTIITKSMFAISNEQTTDDLREQEYNMVILPSNLTSGDTIDIRLRLPSGLDYVVVSKKKVTLPTNLETADNTMFIKETEDEILTMSAAIVDAYKINGSKLYATKYTDPGIQKTANQTYIPSGETLTLISQDPNIVEKAKAELVNYYNQNYSNYRAGIANAINSGNQEEQKEKVESGTSTETSTQTQQRQTYLQSIGE